MLLWDVFDMLVEGRGLVKDDTKVKDVGEVWSCRWRGRSNGWI